MGPSWARPNPKPLSLPGFSLGDELGFPESLGNTESDRRRAISYKNGAPPDLVGVLPSTQQQVSLEVIHPHNYDSVYIHSKGQSTRATSVAREANKFTVYGSSALQSATGATAAATATPAAKTAATAVATANETEATVAATAAATAAAATADD